MVSHLFIHVAWDRDVEEVCQGGALGESLYFLGATVAVREGVQMVGKKRAVFLGEEKLMIRRPARNVQRAYGWPSGWHRHQGLRPSSRSAPEGPPRKWFLEGICAGANYALQCLLRVNMRIGVVKDLNVAHKITTILKKTSVSAMTVMDFQNSSGTKKGTENTVVEEVNFFGKGDRLSYKECTQRLPVSRVHDWACYVLIKLPDVLHQRLNNIFQPLYGRHPSRSLMGSVNPNDRMRIAKLLLRKELFNIKFTPKHMGDVSEGNILQPVVE
ncbi:hypothetical protein BDK51DRAFT_33885 [Blyttiomyces helicus]|uniref:Uncharacterized protein n=1 Tax=Blyttiomyces helicus TaxID=388810 RepID=A0A4P9WU09_9FUNG|nr:hypothetical protein BDK51DRAFT_33885 [Blyttiomyces helicus]|eukprot:RKO94596.1 hypothetical protein BDK51DRAFT_33885 [Blyttiomyces helicus]